MRIDVDSPGASLLASSLARAADELGDLSAADREAAREALGFVRAPVLTGALARSVTAVPDAAGFTLTAGGSTAPYAAIVHARNPFLAKALDQAQTQIVDTYADHVRDAVDQIKGT